MVTVGEAVLTLRATVCLVSIVVHNVMSNVYVYLHLHIRAHVYAHVAEAHGMVNKLVHVA